MSINVANSLLLLSVLIFTTTLMTQQVSSLEFNNRTTPTLTSHSTTLKLYIPSQQEQEEQEEETSVMHFQQEQCNCYTCSNERLIAANTFVILSSLESCQEMNVKSNVAIGLINIISITNNQDGFKYYLVDDVNRNLALSGQVFKYYTYKSSDVASTCVNDQSPAIRIPKKAYIIARSTNNVSGTIVRYNIKMTCATAPYNRIDFTTTSSSLDEKYYIDENLKLNIKFLNENNYIDTVQEGLLSIDGLSYSFVGGEKSLIYTPLTLGSLTISILYTPHSHVYGNPVHMNTTIQVLEKDAITLAWKWMLKDTVNTIISIVVLSGIVIGVLILSSVGMCIICWRRGRRGRRGRRDEAVGIHKSRYETMDDEALPLEQ